MFQHFDLCLAWNWEYDDGFVQLLQAACDSRQFSLLQVTLDNLAATLDGLDRGELSFDSFFDRASDTDERFCALVARAQSDVTLLINPPQLAQRAWNKVEMYEQFHRFGLLMPATLVIPPFQEHADMLPFDLNELGDGFVIKPAHGGGGLGVHGNITNWEQINQARQEFPHDQYLLQSRVFPVHLQGHPAWFRVIDCAGGIYPCWWHPDSHVYTRVTEADEVRFALQPLRSITDLIRRICRLDLFSSEIAITPQGKFLVIDYVNDPIDLRLQSQAADGLPDEIVREIAERLVDIASVHNK
jgi:hypothetical protein